MEATRKGLFEEDRGVLINTLAGTSARAILHAALLLLCSKCTLRPPQLTPQSSRFILEARRTLVELGADVVVPHLPRALALSRC